MEKIPLHEYTSQQRYQCQSFESNELQYTEVGRPTGRNWQLPLIQVCHRAQQHLMNYIHRCTKIA